ncbi:hypothetical protein EZV62_026018 [Acer yangbiense]|uniref:PH domain-containing protein n=1 Tax=Acer yangbiense TaxID=1000413 RepID=A0A5C7GZQ9_9ROSI|nr:hypothetical protein EZV62_026018 [Acer yangbiense]
MVMRASRTRGVIPVASCLTVKGAEDVLNKQYAFELSLRTETMYFIADSEKEDWIYSIGRSIVQHSRRSDDEPVSKRLKKSSNPDHHSFTLKHGSLLVMRGYTQRDSQSRGYSNQPHLQILQLELADFCGMKLNNLATLSSKDENSITFSCGKENESGGTSTSYGAVFARWLLAEKIELVVGDAAERDKEDDDDEEDDDMMPRRSQRRHVFDDIVIEEAE